MNKLSEAQRRVLEAMRDGAELYHSKRIHPNVRLWGDNLRMVVRLSTFEAIRKAGYLEVLREDWKVGKFTISEAGRAALQQRGVGGE